MSDGGGLSVCTITEAERGCGYRTAGNGGGGGVGIYLMGGCRVEDCERLPFPLVVCPCCGEGIRFFRGVRKFRPDKLFALEHEPICNPTLPGHAHTFCPVCSPPEEEEHFIMWVGEKFYPTPSAFIGESINMGVSKRINSIPRGFVLGESIIYLAHKKAIWKSQEEQIAGIFGSFVPKSIDGVTNNPDEIPEKAEKLAKQFGDKFRIVYVVPEAEPQQELIQ